MRILLIAPDQPNLNAVPEIRRLSEMHTVHVFNGPVTYDDLHDAVRHNEYDALHFATHMKAPPDSLDTMALSKDEYIDLNRAVQLIKLSKARVAFFNLCLAARFGAYLVQRGAPFVIFTTVEIPDTDAWSTPVSFYERCRRTEMAGQQMDFRDLLESVDGGDGLYFWAAATNYYGHLLKPLRDAIEELRQQVGGLVTTVEHHARLLNIGQPARSFNSRWLIILAVICALLIIISSALVIGQAIYSLM